MQIKMQCKCACIIVADCILTVHRLSIDSALHLHLCNDCVLTVPLTVPLTMPLTVPLAATLAASLAVSLPVPPIVDWLVY